MLFVLDFQENVFTQASQIPLELARGAPGSQQGIGEVPSSQPELLADFAVSTNFTEASARPPDRFGPGS